MDLTMIADFLSSLNPLVLGGVAGGFLVAGGAGLYVKRNKNKFIENTDPYAQPNDFKTLKTEDLEREFGSLTVQTKMLDEDESLFFDKSPKDKLNENELTQPSTKLVDEASVFDSFGKQDQALESLKKAVDVEKYDKEKVRLKILLSQYNIKKGKVSLDDIIKEYPSFHAKVSFGPDNTLSALMGSAIPKTDEALLGSVNKEIDKDFDIFADLPILNEQVTVSQQNTSPIGIQKDLFDDLPTTKEVTQSDTVNNVSILTAEPSPLFESKVEPSVQPYTQMSLFDDIPPLDPKPNENKEIISSSEHNSSENVTQPQNSDAQFDQFAWNSNQLSHNNVEDDTEKMLKQLQKDAEKIDKVNDTEAMEDMQKFWQEFGNMVVDIKKEVAENHQLKPDNSTEDNILPFNNQTNNDIVKQEPTNQDNTVVNTPLDFNSVANSLPTLSEPVFTAPVESQKQSVSEDLEPPVLNDVISSPVVPPVNYSASPIPPMPTVQEPVIMAKESMPVAPIVVENNTPVTSSATTFEPVAPEVPAKPQTFKVWANWIVTIEGQQVFRNHFINLKNPWGTIKSGEELYGGISRLSGKDVNGKNYPWVLVSVFPLSKE